jgi:hypothetical protein
MKKKSNYRSVWDNTSQPEKERIFRIFLKKYGENYAPEDFVKFLKNRYSIPTYPPTS